MRGLRFKRWLNEQIRRTGYEVGVYYPPGNCLRPMGRLRSFLEDLDDRGYECRRILDVGASDGSWSRMALSVFPDATGLLLEPRQECRPALERFCAEMPNWSYLSAGAASQAGELEMTRWDTASTFLAESVGDVRDKDKVRVVTLDSLFPEGESEEKVPDLVKLDVEGFELEVLRGAERLLARSELFIIEVATFPYGTGRPLLHDVVAYMSERGYLFYDVAGFIRRPFDNALGLLDLVFARRDGVVRKEADRWFKEGEEPADG